MMMRQIHFASVDLELHSRFKPGSAETVFDADRRIAKRTQVIAGPGPRLRSQPVHLLPPSRLQIY